MHDFVSWKFANLEISFPSRPNMAHIVQERFKGRQNSNSTQFRLMEIEMSPYSTGNQMDDQRRRRFNYRHRGPVDSKSNYLFYDDCRSSAALLSAEHGRR